MTSHRLPPTQQCIWYHAATQPIKSVHSDQHQWLESASETHSDEKWVREEVCHMARCETKREQSGQRKQLLIKNGLICSEAAVIIISGDVKRLRFLVSQANTQIQSTDNRGSFLRYGTLLKLNIVPGSPESKISCWLHTRWYNHQARCYYSDMVKLLVRSNANITPALYH